MTWGTQIQVWVIAKQWYFDTLRIATRPRADWDRFKVSPPILVGRLLYWMINGSQVLLLTGQCSRNFRRKQWNLAIALSKWFWSLQSNHLRSRFSARRTVPAVCICAVNTRYSAIFCYAKSKCVAVMMWKVMHKTGKISNPVTKRNINKKEKGEGELASYQPRQQMLTLPCRRNDETCVLKQKLLVINIPWFSRKQIGSVQIKSFLGRQK